MGCRAKWRGWLCVWGALALSAGTQADSWQEALAADAAQLERLHSVIIAHEGQVVYEEVFGGPGLSEPANIKSLSKTVLAALVGAAIDRGVIDSVDQSVVELLGERVPDNATEGVEQITVGHLLSLQAGLERTSGHNYGRWVVSDNWVEHVLTRPFVDEPGGRMLYSSGSTHLLSAALTEASGRSTLELAREWLGEPLNIAIPAWPRDPQGIYFGGNDMLLSPRALLTFGEMVRRGGRHGEQQVLSEDWVRASWEPRGRSAFTGDDYGYGWFALTLGGEQAYYGRGFGGQVLYVLPDLGVTAVFTANPEPPSPGSYYLRQVHQLLAGHLVPALR